MKIDSDEFREWAKKTSDEAWKDEMASAKEEYDEMQDNKTAQDLKDTGCRPVYSMDWAGNTKIY